MSDYVMQRSRLPGRTEVSVLSLLANPPVGWKAAPHYAVFRRVRRVGYEDLPLLSVYRDLGIVPREGRDDNHNRPSEDLSNYQRVNKGDLVINKMKAWQGSVGVSDYQGLVSPAYFVFEPVGRNHGRFLHHLLRSDVYTAAYGAISKGIRVDQWDLDPQEHSRLPVLLPPIEEQRRIAAFLDHETARIDELVREQENLIQFLSEKRQAVIRNVVAKGVNPNVPMRDSGVEWLGQIPAHWEMAPLKHQCRFFGGGTPSKDNPDYWQGEVPWVSAKDMKTFWVSQSIDTITKQAVCESSTNLVEPGALLIVVRSGILQRTIPVGINTVQTAINQDMKALTFARAETAEYVAYLIHGNEAALLQAWRKQGATVESIEQEHLASTLLPVPPNVEVSCIITELRRVINQFEDLQLKSHKAVQLLRERRSALIGAAVTGQLDLRDWRPPEPKAVAEVA